MIYDLIIIGGGPAGITAGIYAARKKLKTLLITKEWGGQMTKATEIGNWPGTKMISGNDLIKQMSEHLRMFEIEIKENKEAIDMNKEVAVVGGGNAGFATAIDLIKYAKKIYILEFFPEMKGDLVTKEKLEKTGKVEFHTNVAVKEIKGNKFMESLTYEDRKTSKDHEIKVEGVFISIGMMPKVGFAQKLVELNKIGEI